MRRLIIVLVLGLFAPAAFAAEPGLTFFAWSDQHVTPQGDGAHVLPAIEAIHALPGTAYPEKIGGKVPAPAFVFSTGDATEQPTPAAVNTAVELLTKRLKFPSFEVVGNHDEAFGGVPGDAFKKQFIARHGALSYTFDRGGVRFIVPFSAYAPGQAITQEALGFIRADLAKTPKGTPVIVGLHLCLDAMSNRDALVESFGNANVVLVLGGHLHHTVAGEYKGYRFLQLPSPKPEPKPQTEVVVIRITADRLLALTWDYGTGKWSQDAKKLIDAPIQGPKAAAAEKPAGK